MLDKKKATQLGVAGGIIGILAVLSVKMGNPGNMGICIACFVRDIAGGLGLHRAEVVQYIRPEIIGLLLGSCLLALFRKEFTPRGGSSPFTRFIIGFFVMIGALMFLGCPFRMVLRIAGGDLNAVIGLVGFILGILVGIFFLNKGFTLKRTYSLSKTEGSLLPVTGLILLILVLAVPGLFFFSSEGPGSKHAAVLISLTAGLIVGALAQRSRFCMVGGIRDFVLFRESTLLIGFVSILVFAIIMNVILGYFHLGFAEQPVAHTDGLWNLLGMLLVGFGCTLLGGCPLRQIVLSGEGNTDSAVTVIGLLVGAACCHNFKLASSAEGPTLNGQIAVIVGLIVLVLIAVMGCRETTNS